MKVGEPPEAADRDVVIAMTREEEKDEEKKRWQKQDKSKIKINAAWLAVGA